ncbi:hypothetical protein CXF86_09530 [Shewanella sp. GutCb]|uniref:hypothetical protein n=1 Tax=Shewanella sp. GutCb TaxID=2058315 RepID=UPI000C7B3416|nr:hypothetical protein [Shewanella sp. GutCb]PKG75197.1 hypothetical protein CXF86_09530 [Shewanella sp. GutCb]
MAPENVRFATGLYRPQHDYADAIALHSIVPAIQQRKNAQIADVKKPVALATGCSLSFETHLRKSGA